MVVTVSIDPAAAIDIAMGPVRGAWRKLCSHRRLTPETIRAHGWTPLTLEQHAILNVWQGKCLTILQSNPTADDVVRVQKMCADMKLMLAPLLGPDEGRLE